MHKLLIVATVTGSGEQFQPTQTLIRLKDKFGILHKALFSDYDEIERF